MLEGVEERDVQEVCDDRSRRRAAPGTYRDVILSGPLEDVPDDQEVRGEAELADDALLVLQSLVRLLVPAAVLALKSLLEQCVKEGLRVTTPLGFEDGDVILVGVAIFLLVAELDVEVDLFSDMNCLGDGVWEIAEDVCHLSASPKEQGVRIELEAVLLGLLGASVDTEEHVLRLTVLMS